MNLNAADLDKMMMQKTANRLPPIQNSGRFLRSFSVDARKHLLTYLLGGLFLVGVLIGTLLVSRCAPDTLETLKTILGGYVERRQTQSFAGIVVSTFSSIFVSLAILFFCGFCSISQPIILAVPLFKGLGYGFSVGTLYAEFGVSAMRYVGFLLLPAMFLGSALIVMATRASMRLSVKFFRSNVAATEQSDPYRARRYCVKYIVFTAMCALISILDAILFVKFSGLIVL